MLMKFPLCWQAGFRRSQDSQRPGPAAADVGDAEFRRDRSRDQNLDSAYDPALDIHPLSLPQQRENNRHPNSITMLRHEPIDLPFLGWSFQDSPLNAAVGVVDENLGAVHFASDPLRVADGVRLLPMPEPVRSASCRLQEPITPMVRVRDDLEDYGLATPHFFSLSPRSWNP
jgi:hypothetical protein